MKRLSIFILSTILFLCGCSSDSSDSSVQSDPQVQESIPTETKSLTSFDDGTITCEYDDSLLLMSNISKNDTFLYGTVFSPVSSDPADSVTNGSSVYVVTTYMDNSDMFETYPSDITRAIFDGVFNASENEANIISNSDGTYEYSLTQSNLVCKGKVFNASDDTISICVYRVFQTESEDLISAFDDCYNSIVFSDTTVNYSDDYSDDYFDRLLAEAEEMASNSTKITDGDLYNSITAIYQDVTITDMDDSILITINLSHSSYEEDTAAFFNIVKSICDSCQLESSYSGVTFSMVVDRSPVTALVLVNYNSPTSFESSEPMVSDDAYQELISQYYNDLFSWSDMTNKFNAELDELRDEYNIPD